MEHRCLFGNTDISSSGYVHGSGTLGSYARSISSGVISGSRVFCSLTVLLK
jgi:hypothetical protein